MSKHILNILECIPRSGKGENRDQGSKEETKQERGLVSTDDESSPC